MIPIRDFTDQYQNRIGKDVQVLDWNRILLEAGYYPVIGYSSYRWTEKLEWCQRYLSENQYVWVGYNFYFTRSEDAVLFKLKWA